MFLLKLDKETAKYFPIISIFSLQWIILCKSKLNMITNSKGKSR